MGFFSSTKSVIICLVLFAVCAIFAGFIKGAIAQWRLDRKIGREEAARRQAEEAEAERARAEKESKIRASREKKEARKREQMKPKVKRLAEGKEAEKEADKDQ